MLAMAIEVRMPVGCFGRHLKPLKDSVEHFAGTTVFIAKLGYLRGLSEATAAKWLVAVN